MEAGVLRAEETIPLCTLSDPQCAAYHEGSQEVRPIVSPDDAWSVIGPNTPQKPDRTVPDQLSKWSLEHRWDISNVSAEMVKEFKEKYKLK